MDFSISDDHRAIREGVRAVVRRFDDEYWLARDDDGKFPTAFHRANTHRVVGWDELVAVNAADGGFLVAGWCGSPDCERDVQATTGATLRVLPFAGELANGEPLASCVRCGTPAAETAVFARAY